MRASGTLLLFPVTLAVLLAAGPASARTTITPYIQAEQVFSADLSGHDSDNVTYTGLGAGVDIQFDSAHLHGQIDYQYNHYFSWSKRYRDTDLHQGLGSVHYAVAPGLTLDASGVATRTRGSLNRSSPGLLDGDFDNTNQVYGIDAGPTYQGHLGDFDVNARYRFGWVKSTDGTGIDLGPGGPVLSNNFTDMSHTVDASVGQRPGVALPFGWTASGGYIRDQVHFLDARYTGAFGRVDIEQPVSPTLALLAGAGYQSDKSGQAALLTDADGNARLTANRHLQGDRSKPRVLSYDQDGLVWDVGVLWRPSSRTSLRIRGGQRYGQTVVTGEFTHQITPNVSVQVVAYDDITSFGRQVSSGIDGLPANFSSPIASVPMSLSGCVFGANGGQGACLPGLTSVNSNFYRSRGIYGMISGQRGLWGWGLGLNYDNRHYFAPKDGTAAATFAGVDEETVTLNGVVQRRLSAMSSVTGNVYAAWYDGGLSGGGHYTTYGATVSYNRNITRRLSGDASVSVYSGSGGTVDQDVIGSAQIGVRYTL
ncbi:MAG TPA: hypothetical protein VGC10_01125 [Sphingomonas sp.]